MEEEHKFLQTSFSPSDNTTTTNVNASADHFIVEDLFDFSNDDTAITDPIFESLPANSSVASPRLDTTTTTTTTHHSSNFLADGHFSSDLSVPYDDLVELEWLSKFADESFSNEEVQDMQLTSNVKVVNYKESFSSEKLKKVEMISGMNKATEESFSSEDVQKKTRMISRVKEVNEESFSSEYLQKVHMVPSLNDVASQTCEEVNPISNPQVAVRAKARSKRSRGPLGKWKSRIPLPTTTTTSSSSQSDTVGAPQKKHVTRRRDSSDGCDGRKCLHCATDKTPQWRTGPMGPKTLCNACGVRYKSGRLVPEYRPAASPTFMLTKHSNSHRKVLELRRQKEMRAQQQQALQLQHQQSMMFDHIPSSSNQYFIHQQHMGPDFSHLL